jgi:hypothetical protein
MTKLFILDVPDFRPIIGVVTCRTVGDYVEVASDGAITIDRRATGVNHATWYSMVAAVADGRVVQQDKDALQVVPA